MAPAEHTLGAGNKFPPRRAAALVLLVVLLLAAEPLHAQDGLGFGCLGLVGAYAGYEVQQYKPAGWNAYVRSFNLYHKDSLIGPLNEFGDLRGFRFGANIFRKNYDGLIFTVKGYYQVLKEKHDATIRNGGVQNIESFEMKLNNIALAVDVGTQISSFLSWKVLEAAVLFNRTSLSRSVSIPGKQIAVETVTSERTAIGYSLGSGFILNLIENFISLEGTASYNIFSVGKMKYSSGAFFPSVISGAAPMEQIIDNGGLTTVVQINIGFPL